MIKDKFNNEIKVGNKVLSPKYCGDNYENSDVLELKKSDDGDFYFKNIKTYEKLAIDFLGSSDIVLIKETDNE